MLTLSLLLSAMLLSALSLLLIPCWVSYRQQKSSWMIMVITSSLMLMMSVCLYTMSSNRHELKQWLSKGERHYHLMVQYNALGGVSGLIARVQKKLDENPTDEKGWLILAKLYLINHDYKSAKYALMQAQHLNPSDPEIAHYLTLQSQASA